MKYGDPVATWRIAVSTFDHFWNSSLGQEMIQPGKEIVLTSSAYGSVPTASYWVKENLGEMMKEKGARIQKVKFEREGGFGCHNYSQLGVEERRKILEGRKIWLDQNVDLKGKNIVVFDDLRSTGAHEESLREILSNHVGVRRIVFLYFIGFRRDLGQSKPQEENVLNHSEIKDVEDLLRLSLQAPDPLLLNARLVKLLLKSFSTNQALFNQCLPRFPQEFLQGVVAAAKSRDGYAVRNPYQSGFEALQSFLHLYN